MGPLHRSFPQFSRLPAELRALVWEEARPRPGIHVFDVCIPSLDNGGRSARAFGAGNWKREEDKARYERFRNKVFLDAFEIGDGLNHNKSHLVAAGDIRQPFTVDPSMYIADDAIRASCYEAATSLPSSPGPGMLLGSKPHLRKEEPDLSSDENFNAVYLPGKDKWVYYDNTSDILFLRCGAAAATAETTDDDEPAYRAFDSGISDLLSGNWSSEMADRLRKARRIAIDIAETGFSVDVKDFIYQEVAFLCCCLQQSLEVLYLIDNRECRCQRCQGDLPKPAASPDVEKEPQVPAMFSTPTEVQERKPDVIYGVGVTYREVVDINSLAWEDSHPAFSLITMFDEVIRSQQGSDDSFQGIRVLTRQHEPRNLVDSSRL